MPRCRVSRLYSLAWVLLLLPYARLSEIAAQNPDSSSTSTRYSVDGRLVDALPIDRASDALLFLPGVTTDNTGELLVRGGEPGDAAVYLDGVPLLSAFRSTPFFGLSISRNLESRTDIGPNLVDSVGVATGPMPAELGNAQSGAISIYIRKPQPGITGSVAYESDEPFGGAHSFGLNRLEGTVEGTLSGLGFLVGGMLEGQRSVERGFDSEDAPVFVLARLDTTVAVASTPGDPLSDTTQVPVYDFAAARGQCDDFASSNNPDIAGNYGFDCQGARTPSSPVSTYELLGKLTYGWGRSRLSLLAVADQHQNRNFDYGTLYNSVEATGNRTTSSAIMLGWSQQLNRNPEKPLLLDAHLSFQSDRERSGPLAPEGEENTADPFGGFLLSPLDLRFDFDNFPVNDELINNYRTNQVGSRRSPYDLENTSQYQPVDRYRNNAYGLYNRDFIAPAVFNEQGGPIGLLFLYRETRTLGTAEIAWRPSASHQIRVGGEFTRYSVANYFHFLDSQLLSDVYSEHPVRGAVFLQDQLALGEAAITAGVRYDFFDTRARRPADFPRISSHPLFDPSDPEAFFTDDSLFPRDQSHGYLSPRIQAAFVAGPRTVFRGGVAAQAQVPDFRESLLRVNTDLSTTDPGITVFGSDLDFEHTTTFELGMRHGFTSNLEIDLSVYSSNMESQVAPRIVQRFDPLQGTNRILQVLTNEGTQRIRGVDFRLAGQLGPALSGWLAYSYQDATSQELVALGREDWVPTLNSRPHTVAAAVALQVPRDWKSGSLAGAILQNVGAYTVLRVASGTPFTRCSGDNSILSPGLCFEFPAEELNASRLPTYKQLDLRLSKRFGPEGRFAGYVDARNLLNFRNVFAVFAATGETTNSAEVNTNWSADSADYSNEAEQNGRYALDGTINLGQGLPDARLTCAAWTDQAGNPAAPNCVYLIRAEERFGNGDHLFDLAEQRRASEALYRAVRGPQEFTGPPRRIRLGLEVGF